MSGPVRRNPGSGAATYPIGGAPLVRGANGRYAANGGLHSRLRMLGVLGTKHIPEEYLRASEDQRRGLLAGIVDSDGHVSCVAHIEVVSVHERLASGVLELARSLGFKASILEDRAQLNGKDAGPRWRVTWTAREQVATLPRKQVRPAATQAARTAHRYITAVEPVPSAPVRCITVDAPSALYLAGEAMVPTHNTRIGAETVREEVEAERAERIAFVGRTVGEVRTVMIEGESGLQAAYPPRLWGRSVVYEPSKRQVQWLAPGQRFVAGRDYTGPARRALALTFSDDEPDQLRGPQHDFAWVDEPAKFINAWGPRGTTAGDLPLEGGTWSNLLLGLRLGRAPRWVATTTPKPVKLIRHLVKLESVEITRGSSYDNVENLAASYVAEVLEPYRGTRLERQEIAGELIEQVEGALWAWSAVEAAQLRWRAFVEATGRPPEHRRVVVGVDPAASSGDDADDTGIYVCGRQAATERYSVIADYSRSRATVGEWTRAVVDAYHDHRADEVVAEVNNGGDMVEAVIRNADPRVKVTKVHATRGKRVRAEPIALLYDRGQVDHAAEFPALVDQMTSWTPDSLESPDHLDAVVWALTRLSERKQGGGRAWAV